MSSLTNSGPRDYGGEVMWYGIVVRVQGVVGVPEVVGPPQKAGSPSRAFPPAQRQARLRVQSACHLLARRLLC